jgi:beta-lactam-binding protein with PASTA domain
VTFMRRLKTSRYWWLIRWLYYAFGVLLVFITVAIIGNAIVMPLVTRHGTEFPTPSIIGKNLREGEAILKAAGLRIEIESRQHSPSVPEGVILDQVPPPQAMVKKNRRIKVIVSSGARMTVVPFLRGYTPRQAQLMLDEAGLSMGGESFARDDSLPSGVVVSSIPAGGGSVPAGTVVNIMINEADEFELVTVPILVGENIKVAESLLDRRGLILGAIYREIDSVLLPGTVLRQSVEAGEQVRRGTSINLTIASENW